MINDTSPEQINTLLEASWEAFQVYKKLSLKDRANLMRAIAASIGAVSEELVQIAMAETHLPNARLTGEKNRTVYQLTSYAEACERGQWLGAAIDTAIPDKTPPKPDIRKTMVPLGPVLVFGASNFPFAYSTAGGDTACALAAGCPVIVKAHPAHPETSDRVARAIWKAIEGCGLPKAIFTHIHGAGFETGKMLVTHPRVKAVGFTGSFQGGKALFDWANQRSEPIPVFSEMGSVNPVFLLPDYLKKNAREAASLYAGSITLGVGQFCTNPGLIFGLEGRDLDLFCQELSLEIEKIAPAPMLHPGIAKNYFEKRTAAMAQPGVSQIAMAAIAPKPNEGAPTIATVAGKTFLQNPLLHQEVFGPYSLVVRCSNIAEIELLVQQLEGQLTATIMASEWDLEENGELVESVKQICGRLIFNSVPTGVEVCQAMHHGGPFPATTDSRFTSVGADGIKRFARPISFQNWPDSHLPQELRNANPLSIWRVVNNELTKGSI